MRDAVEIRCLLTSTMLTRYLPVALLLSFGALSATQSDSWLLSLGCMNDLLRWSLTWRQLQDRFPQHGVDAGPYGLQVFALAFAAVIRLSLDSCYDSRDCIHLVVTAFESFS